MFTALFQAESLIKGVGLLAFIWYYVSLLYVGFGAHAPGETDSLREYMAVSITTISSTLATFIGMAFGFQQVKSKAKAQQRTPDHAETAALNNLMPLSAWQTAAALAYIASLVFALVIWWWLGEKCDPVIQNVGRSFLGIVGGLLAVVLNVRT